VLCEDVVVFFTQLSIIYACLRRQTTHALPSPVIIISFSFSFALAILLSGTLTSPLFSFHSCPYFFSLVALTQTHAHKTHTQTVTSSHCYSTQLPLLGSLFYFFSPLPVPPSFRPSVPLIFNTRIYEYNVFASHSLTIISLHSQSSLPAFLPPL
jgi:hypothetical protein